MLSLRIWLVLAFSGVLAMAWHDKHLPLWVIVAYGLLSVVTFGLYAIDKATARADGRRTPERTLHWLALAGGWPGALLAQQMLRHKSSKRSFLMVFWLTLVLHCAALSAYLLRHLM